jgi:hypothetical protein
MGRGERGFKTDVEASVDGGLPPGIEDPPEADLLDWKNIDSIGAEQARIYALWRTGKVGNRGAKTGMYLLSRLIETCERANGTRMAEIEELLAKVQSQVALADHRAPSRLV